MVRTQHMEVTSSMDRRFGGQRGRCWENLKRAERLLSMEAAVVTDQGEIPWKTVLILGALDIRERQS